MKLVEVVAKTSFVSQSLGSVNKKQKLNVSEEFADHLRGLGLVDYPKKQDSVTEGGEVTQSALLLAETVLPTTTLTPPKRDRGRRAGKQS